MFEKSNVIKNNTGKFEGNEKPVSQESKGLKVRIEWEEKAREAMEEDYRNVVTEALEYIEEEKIGGSVVILEAECIKKDDYHATIKLKSHDWVSHINWEIKIEKYSKKWKFVSISRRGGESVFNPDEE